MPNHNKHREDKDVYFKNNETHATESEESELDSSVPVSVAEPVTDDVTDSSIPLNRRSFLGGVAGTVVTSALTSGVASAYQTDSAVEQRVTNLVDKMTLDEKIQMVHGVPGPATGYIPPIERLDIPSTRFDDGPVGVRNGLSTAFPATIAAASTWDRDLIQKEGSAMGSEAKAKETDVLFAPAQNIDRVPVGGRVFEYYSEDPYLSARMSVANITGIESEGIIATAKHYLANNQERNRFTYNAEISERAMREIYLPSFKAAVEEANTGSVMAAYDRVNGVYSTENSRLLQDILKDDFGFEGFVVSDYGATHSTVNAANAGLDVQPGYYVTPSGNDSYFGEPLKQAVQNGKVSMKTLDEKVRRILRQLALSGALDNNKKGDPGAANTDAHQMLSRQIAEEGAVLLKNENETLPVDTETTDSIAVIGPKADEAHVGGGGSSDVQPPYSVSPFESIKDRVGSGTSVTYAPGIIAEGYPAVPSSALTPPNATDDQHGLQGDYFNNTDFSGDPKLTRIDDQIDFSENDISKIDGLSATDFSVRWTGTFIAPKAGTYVFSLTSDDGSHLYFDGEEVIDNGGPHAPKTKTTSITLDEGESRNVRIDWYQGGGGATVTFGWQPPQAESPFDTAVETAKAADVAFVFADGSSSEGSDRDDLVLNDGQNDLISAVANANDQTTVVLRTGGPIVMPWIDTVPTILEMWYPGMEDGNATTAILFGDANPSGKLPITFGKEFKDYPANPVTHPERYPGIDSGNGYPTAEYSEGVFVGYRYFDEQNTEPLFAFGHGESYTDFEYSDLKVRPKKFQPKGTLTVDAQITNTGDRAGAEIVQLYVDDRESTVDRPPKELKAFEKVKLDPGENQKVQFKLGREALSFWSPNASDWTVENGEFEIMVGASSRDLPLRETIEVHNALGARYISIEAPEIVSSGESATVATTFTNSSDYTAKNVEFDLQVPNGWSVNTQSHSRTKSVQSGGTAEVDWTISAPESAKPDEYNLTAEVTYHGKGGKNTDQAHAPAIVPYESLVKTFNNDGVSTDTDPTTGNFDGKGFSYSGEDLAAEGLSLGATVTQDGLTFTWPDVPFETSDANNTTSSGQTVDLSESGSRLGFIGAGANGSQSGEATIYYADGTAETITISFADWYHNNSLDGNSTVASPTWNIPPNANGFNPNRNVGVYSTIVSLQSGKTVEAVTLPSNTDLHLFAITLG